MAITVREKKLDNGRGVKEASITPFTKRPTKRGEEPPADWPEFGDYTRPEYPDELDEGLVVLIERFIEERGTLSG
jgi:hypothetical protein